MAAFKLEDKDIPQYGPGEQDAPDEDFDKRIAWLIANRRRLAWIYGADEIVLTPERVLLYKTKGGQ